MGVGGCCNLERPPQHLHTAHRPDVDKITAFNYKVKERLLEKRRNSILVSYRVYGLLLMLRMRYRIRPIQELWLLILDGYLRLLEPETPTLKFSACRPEVDIDKITALNYKIKERLLERRRNSILLSYRVHGLLLMLRMKNSIRTICW